MSDINGSQGREIRLLVVTLAVSAVMLALLARVRFPDRPSAPQIDSAAAPLERLATRTAYDELALAMAEVERRVTPSVLMIPVRRGGGDVAWTPALRVTPDRAVATVSFDDVIVAAPGTPSVVSRDDRRGIAVFAVDSRPGDVVTPRSGAPRTGPRYVAVLEGGTTAGTVRPAYLGRVELVEQPRFEEARLAVSAAPQTIPHGAAVFSLEGRFIGLADARSGSTTIIPVEALTSVATSAATAPIAINDLGLEVQALNPALSRATNAAAGVIVAYVRGGGRAADVITTGDVIRAVNGIATESVEAFHAAAAAVLANAPVTFDITRAGKSATVTVAQASSPATSVPTNAGFSLSDHPDRGVVVAGFAPEGPIARSGLQLGDVLVAVNGQRVGTAEAARRAIEDARPRATLLLTVRRGTAHTVVALERT